MKRLLAILCTLALMLSVINPAVFAAENSSLQAAMDDDSSEIIVLEEDTSDLTVDRDTYLDLNGHNLDGVTVTGGTLYCMDSQTADYTVADGVYGHVTNVTGSVKAAEGYLQVGDSFHAVNLDIYAMTLRAADVGVYYKSHFAADEVVAAQVESFGVALSVVTAPNAENLDSYCGYSVFEGFEAGEGANATGTSTLLKGIMKAANGDNKNAKNAAMPIYGRAYIKTAEGYVFGETVKRSLQEQVEAIDGVWASLKDSQKAPVLGMLESYTAVMEGWNIPNIQGIQVPGADEEIQIPVNVTAENGIVTEAVTVEQDGVSVTVPAGVKLAEGATALTLTVTPKETSDTGIELEKNQVLMPMDVHVEGLAADNAQPLTIYLGKIMPENLNMGNYAVYHVENGKANEMTLIPVDAEFTAHNQYKYTLDGELTLYVANFSEIAPLTTTDNTWNGGRDYDWYDADAEILYIRNADQLAGFGAIVGGMAEGIEQDDFTGKTVILLADINLGDADNANKNLIFHPIGYYYTEDKNSDGTAGDYYSTVYSFSGIFDGNGNTIANFYQNTWEIKGDYEGNYYDEAMGLFGYVVDGTVRNLTVKGFSSDGEFTPTGVIAAYAKGNVIFENIAIVDCNPRVYNTGNGGIVGWDDGGDSEAEASSYTFKNITIDNTNTISALWGSWDVACGGLMGYLGGYSKVNMTNCHVAAQIDVNNDVCGNYQYYWYRYSGMMIGTIDRHTTDDNGYTIPDTSGITATDCTVHFGDWNNYWYCELVANTKASYTHDHQFSRLVRVAAVNGTTVTPLEGDPFEVPASGRYNYVVVTEPYSSENAACYHFVDGEVHDHDDYDGDDEIDYETVNGNQLLVENNRHIYLPFNQLFTGYGWGVKNIPVYNGEDYAFEGITILDRETADSLTKFIPSATVRTIYTTGETIEVGTLFEPVAGVSINQENVQVFITPADPDDAENTVAGVYAGDTSDWTKGTLSLSGRGEAIVSVTDYEYCKTATIRIAVRSLTEDLVFEDEAKTIAYCPYCKTTKTWTALSQATHETAGPGKVEQTGIHYYLADEITYTGTTTFISSPGSGRMQCLHLNGKDITITGNTCWASAGGGVLNIIGSGAVQKTASSNSNGLLYTNTTAKISELNVYGGEYIVQSSSKRLLYIRGNGGTINVYNDVVLTGDVEVSTANKKNAVMFLEGVTVNGNITIESPTTYNSDSTLKNAKVSGTVTVTNEITSSNTQKFTVSGSTVIPQLVLNNNAQMILDNLTEGANIKVNVSGMTDPAGAISVSNANAKAALKYVFAYTASDLIYEKDGQLYCRAKTHTDDLVFPDGDNKAYCTVCEKTVEWTGIGGTYETAIERLIKGQHIYLIADTTYTGSDNGFISAPIAANSKVATGIGSPACVHLNGYNLEAPKYVFNGYTGSLNVLGRGIVTSKTAQVVNANTVGFSVVSLYSGTYTQAEGNTAYVMVAGGNGGKFNIYEDVVINAINGKGISMDHAGLRANELYIYGATINGDITIKSPRKSTSSDYADPDKYQYYQKAGIVEVLLKDAKINGTVTVNDALTEDRIADGKYVSVSISGATKISKVVLQNAAKLTLGELDTAAEIVVSASGAEDITVTSANSNQVVYCKDGIIVAETETTTEPEEGTETEETTGE